MVGATFQFQITLHVRIHCTVHRFARNKHIIVRLLECSYQILRLTSHLDSPTVTYKSFASHI